MLMQIDLGDPLHLCVLLGISVAIFLIRWARQSLKETLADPDPEDESGDDKEQAFDDGEDDAILSGPEDFPSGDDVEGDMYVGDPKKTCRGKGMFQEGDDVPF